MSRSVTALAACLAVSAALSAYAEAPGQRTYANPVDIDYRYNFEQLNDNISYRTGADPAIVRHKGAYYMFQTLADGYWRSENLADWTFIKPSQWPEESIVAPAAFSDGDRLYMMPSRMEPGVIYVSDAPETGRLDYLTRRTPPLPSAIGWADVYRIKPDQIPPGPWDPGLFKDDDGKWYLYWNSSNVFPLYGIEFEMGKDRITYKGTPVHMPKLDPDNHGWERFGQDHCGCLPNGTKISPFTEGAWMTKVRGKYYLQYGAPGTEYNVYANGTYVADSPLGPFEYAPYNPVAYKPGGFVEGAGHGSTFDDVHGNYWNTGTPWVGANWTFERRIAMFPTVFHEDGQMEVSTRFGDFPHYIPDGKIDDPDSLFTGWMLLSYRKPVTASSTMGEFAASRVTDENPRTYWVAAQNQAGETLTLDLGAAKTVRAVQVNFADYKSGRFADAPDIYTAFKLEHSTDGQHWQALADTGAEKRDRTNAYFELPQAVKTRFIRYVHGHVGAAHLAISDIRVFGTAGGTAPVTPKGLTARRSTDTRDARIAWQPVKGAVGYNVRWGVRPDRLSLTYQLFAEDVAQEFGPHQQGNQLDLRSLNVGVGYYVAVEAFNESGVSKLSKVIRID